MESLRLFPFMSDVLQFQCSACQHTLTVPGHLAGVSGPCPVCGTIVTSPSAAPVFGTPAYGAPTGLNMPAPQPAILQASAPTSTLPVLPKQHIQPMSGAPLGGFPSGGMAHPMPAAPPTPPTPPWQSPGLGQTILESIPAPGAAQASAPPMTSGGGFLPPKRPEGQLPQFGSGSMPGAMPGASASAGVPWGGGPSSGMGMMPATPQLPPMETAPARPAASPGHSTLIPGSPSLPLGGAGGATAAGNGSLLGRSMHAAPLGQPPPLNLPLQLQSPAAPGLPQAMPTSKPSPRSRPMSRPRKSTNVFMIGLAIIFLGGFLAAIGWLFREPLMQLAGLSAPAPSDAASIPVASSLPGAGAPSVTPPTPKPEAPAPKLPSIAEAPAPTRPPGGAAFDPSEVSKVPTSAPAPAPVLTTPPGVTQMPSEEPSMTIKPLPAPAPLVDKKDSPLLEVVQATPAKNTATRPSSASQEASPVTKEIRLDDVTPEAKPAADALMQFLKAGSLQERLKHTLAAEHMRPIMERYYGVNPDGPILVDAIALVRHDPKPQIGGGAHAVFGLESKTWQYPVPVMLEQTDDGFKVDWLSFVEFKDRLLEKFLQGYQEGPARFHVGITRTHYFEDKVPNSSNKDAFRISPAPPNPFVATIFMDKDSDLARELRDKVPWGAQVWAIVELEWNKLGNLSWVSLSAVPQLNWYSVPATEGSAAQRRPMEGQVPTETQKAVPVGR